MSILVTKNPRRALETGAKVGSSAVFKNCQATLSTNPDLINIYHTKRGIYLGKIVEIVEKL